ncbi:hypothetical protein GAYE_SCF23G4326 [Galdieria yellowstonensis]|uniref:Reverse transcriptase domain-containing protein n=1 Tax=Galdieria yellowstonensis TaxID=3028027 RepID=A0AAV9IGA9_9RHOD|nr:hypothetical protein GAYE_SCF23G4326 [Galdieria yellowstonensis]
MVKLLVRIKLLWSLEEEEFHNSFVMNHPMSRVLLGLLSWTFQSSKIPSSLNISSNLRNGKGRFEFHELLSRHHVSNNDGAFDRVPPEALFRKLASLGIEGGCLKLYCRLYRRSWTQLPLRIFKILAPLSFLFVEEQDWMILHLVFCSIWSSIVNGTSAENRISGLMFADDVVLLNRSWIVWKPPGQSKWQWQMQGKDIPVVQEYRHLDIDLNTSLTAEGLILQLQIQRHGQ